MFKDTVAYKMAENITSLENKEDKIFKFVLDTQFIKQFIVSLNTHTQLGDEHVDSDGNPLTNQFNDRTTYSLFDEQGRGGQPYKLYLTGAFWESFKVTINNGYIDINSNPQKEDDNLFDMFGSKIEGLTEESKELLRKVSLPLYEQFFRQQFTSGNLARL